MPKVPSPPGFMRFVTEPEKITGSEKSYELKIRMRGRSVSWFHYCILMGKIYFGLRNPLTPALSPMGEGE